MNAAPPVAELMLLGEVGHDIDPRQVLAELRTSAGGDVRVILDSGGGDAFAGLSVYEALRSHPGRVEVHIVGVAASAASVIAMAGDTVTMAPTASLMIHDAWCMTLGDERDHRAAADLLAKVSNTIAGVYAARAGGSASEWRQVMRNEAWYTAPEAVEADLADRIVDVGTTDVQARVTPARQSTGHIAASMRCGLRPALDPGQLLNARLRAVQARRPAPSAMSCLRELRAARR